jgi:peptidoglycan/LPS O-acetylase OafA/YrhL
MVTPSPRIGKLIELDSLRGFMAFWVYLSHLLFTSGMGAGRLKILANGAPAVTVFMALSGFAIATSLLHTKATYGQYLARRAARIYPIYLVGLLLGIATYAGYPSLLADTGNPDLAAVAQMSASVASEDKHLWLHVLSHLTLIHGMIPDNVLYGAALTINAPAWSLSLEMQFYVAAPFLVKMLNDPLNNIRGLFITAIIAGFGVFAAGYYPEAASFLPIMIGWFVVGIATAIALPTLNAKPAALVLVASVFLAVAIASARFAVIFPAVTWSVVILACSVDTHPVLASIRRVMLFRPAALFGEISYGFYIIHMPIMIVWAEWLYRHGLTHKPIVYAALLTATFPITTALAYFSYRFIEAPINRWAKIKFRGVALHPVSRTAQIEYVA